MLVFLSGLRSAVQWLPLHTQNKETDLNAEITENKLNLPIIMFACTVYVLVAH